MSTASPRRRRPVQVVVGLVLSVLAFVGVVVVARLASPPTQKITIIGAAREIHVGRVVTAEDLGTASVDAPGPTGALRDRTAAVGRVARTTIKVGDPVLDTSLANQAAVGPSKLFFTIPSGKVALNIPAGDISPYVQPGDEVDVIATPKAAGGASTTQQTKTTVKGLLVLAVGSPGQAAQGAATSNGGNLVVEVSLQDAEALQFIVKNTDFTYVLKSPQDASAPDPATPGMDLNQFKALYGFR